MSDEIKPGDVASPSASGSGLVKYKVDQRPPQGGWANGYYAARCWWCGQLFIGDKRAVQCADCAYTEAPNDKLTHVT